MAVVGDGPRLRGEGDEAADAIARAGEPRLDVGRFQGVADPETVDLERVVAAGVEENHLRARMRRQVIEDVADLQGLLLDVIGSGQFGVDGDDEIVAGDLNAVTRIVDQRNVGIVDVAKELAQQLLDVEMADVGAEEGLEAGVAQRVAHLGWRR